MAKNEEGFADDPTIEADVGYMMFGDTEEASRGEEPEEKEEEELGEEEEEELGEEDEEEEEEEGIALPEVKSEEAKKERTKLLKAYTNATKGISALRIKAGLVDQIEQNPEVAIKALATRYGIKLAGEEHEESKDIEFDLDIADPTKDESMSTYLKRVLKPFGATLAKSISKQVQDAVKQAPRAQGQSRADMISREMDIAKKIEYLDSKYPDWGLYESAIVTLARAKPALVQDLDLLYKLGKEETIKAMRGAAKKKVAKGKVKKVTSGERATKPVKGTSQRKVMNFDQAWGAAMQKVRSSK